MTKRVEVHKLFESFSADGQKLTLLEFVDFLREEQKEGDRASDLALELIDRYEPSDSGKGTGAEAPATGAGRGTMTGKVQRPAARCLTPGRLIPPLPCSPVLPRSSHSTTPLEGEQPLPA